MLGLVVAPRGVPGDDADVTVRRSAIEVLERITRNTLGFNARASSADRRLAIARWRTRWTRTERQLQDQRT